MTETSKLIERIEKHCAERGITASTFGFHVVNDGKLIERLKNGKTITLKTLAKIEAALSSSGEAA